MIDQEDIAYEDCDECDSEEGIAEFLGQMDDGTWLSFASLDGKLEEKTLCMECLFVKYATLLGYSADKLQ